MYCTNHRVISLLRPLVKCTASALKSGCRQKLKQSWVMPSAVFFLAIAFQVKFSHYSKISRNFGSIPKTCLDLFFRPRESIRPGPSWKSLRSIAGVQCWRPPVTGCQVIKFVLRRLCPCRRITTVQHWPWTPTRVCTITTPLHSLHELGRQYQPSQTKLSLLKAAGSTVCLLKMFWCCLDLLNKALNMHLISFLGRDKN